MVTTNFNSSPEVVSPPATRQATIMLWSGRVLTVLLSVQLFMSAAFKFIQPPFVVEEFQRLGYSPRIAVAIGVVEVVCVLVYLIPQTSVLGAILLTGYLGGAIATHVRIDDPWLSPVIIGVLIWLGVYLRDARLRALIPLRR